MGTRKIGEWVAKPLPAPVMEPTRLRRAVLRATKKGFECLGHVAVVGSTLIGPPEGPPGEKRFAALGL